MSKLPDTIQKDLYAAISAREMAEIKYAEARAEVSATEHDLIRAKVAAFAAVDVKFVKSGEKK